jgi:hypothetical protein
MGHFGLLAVKTHFILELTNTSNQTESGAFAQQEGLLLI